MSRFTGRGRLGTRRSAGDDRRRGRAPWIVAGIAAIALASATPAFAQDSRFRRGDSNDDGVVDISDGILTLLYLFSGDTEPQCLDAVDADDSGVVDLTDAVYTFNWLFTGGMAPPAPGPEACGSDPTADDLSCRASTRCATPPGDTDLREVGHLLNRIAYGPGPAELERVQEIGLSAYIEEQLHPEDIDPSENTRLRQLEEALFVERQPARDRRLISAGSLWRYRKGTSQPPADWNRLAFDDASWAQGPTSIGYGDGDDRTILADMRRIADEPATPEDESQPGYLSVYLRKTFQVDDPEAIDRLVLRVDYDDGFIAYLNGVAVVRANMPSGTVGYNSTADGGHEAGGDEEFDITARKRVLEAGENVLAIQVHNRALDSSDLTLLPELIQREILPGEPIRSIDGVEALQRLVHVRGVHSRRQLQAVLAEFWENHFTTDFDKLAEYFDDLQNSDATDAMGEAQARAEAAQVEYLEYEFFHEHALGYFGDLLLYSATSPAMNVYLDNVLNVKGAPNENYAREILELHTFGVDNGYDQTDIEQLSKAFTGWSICKVLREDKPAFPDWARDPLTVCGVQFEDSEIVGLGSGWQLFKGQEEPTPDGDGAPTTAWTGTGFDPAGWSPAATGVGYGDGDDRTVLRDMRNNYVSVYLRREFSVDDPESIDNFIFEVAYDDSFVAYLNGVEVARSENLEDAGSPPSYDAQADENHEVDDGTEYINLNAYDSLLREAPETNVLAIQVHNVNLDSSDLSMLPRLLDRRILPGSVENGNRNGVWVFRFAPELHDTTTKLLFRGSPWETRIPAGRTGVEGVNDALEVIDTLVGHPSTAEFICIKLIQRFVSDEISLATLDDGTAPVELRELLADMVAAWNSDENPRPGHIRTVLRVLLDPEDRESAFWSDLAYRAKVKTPVEFINSSLRVLDASISGDDLPELNDDMGMNLFTRDDPDGWSELGVDWIDTARVLRRIDFAQELSANEDDDYRWDALRFFDAVEAETPEQIVDWLDTLLFQNTLRPADRELLTEFLATGPTGDPRPLDRTRAAEFRARVQDFLGLVLSMPQWNFQ